jgi:intein/homing endonuclease
MPVPKHGITLYNNDGTQCDIDEVIDEVRQTPGRLIVDDDLSVAVNVAGLGYATHSMNLQTKEMVRAPITVIHKRKKQAQVLRISTESGIDFEVSEDTLLHIRDSDGQIKHVRADMLRPGMLVLTGVKDDGTPGVIVY